MLTIEAMVAGVEMGGVRLAYPCAHAHERTVREVAIMDVEPFLDDFETFQPHEAVFTSLGFARHDPALADRSLVRLTERGVAAVFVKDALGYEPGPEVERASARAGVPVFFYAEGYLERIISAARQLIAEERERDRAEQAVRALLGEGEERDVRQELFEATGIAAPFVQAVAFGFAVDDDSTSAESSDHGVCRAAAQENLARHLAEEPAEAGFVCRYGAGLLMLRVAQSASDVWSARELDGALQAMGANVRAGLGETLPTEAAPAAIREALGALDEAARQGKRAMCWSDLGISAFSCAVQTSALMQRACAAGRAKLDVCAEFGPGDLTESMRAFVACGGSATAAAELLHQHPNSVRNRVRRARTVLGMEDTSEREFFAYLTMLYL